MAKYFRNVVFTINNYTQEEIDHLKKLDEKYIIFGKEIGDTVWMFDSASIQTEFGGAKNNSLLAGLLG